MNLELEKKKLELRKVETAMHENHFKILERKADIKRLEHNIEKQEETLNNLKEEISSLER